MTPGHPSSVFDRLTDRSRRVLRIAGQVACGQHRVAVTLGDLLFGMIHERQGVAARVLAKFGITVDILRPDVRQKPIDEVELVELRDLQFESAASNCLDVAAEESHWLGHRYIGTEHLLLALCRSGPPDVDTLPLCINVNLQDLMKECVNVVQGNIENWKKHHPDIDFSTGVQIY